MSSSIKARFELITPIHIKIGDLNPIFNKISPAKYDSWTH